jgi:hypothetical protein
MFDALIKGLSLPHRDTLEIMFSPYSFIMKKEGHLGIQKYGGTWC